MLMIDLMVLLSTMCLVAKEGHVGGILEVDKQVVKSRSTSTTNNHAD